MTNLDDAVARLRDAWDNAGRVPAYHYRAKAELHDTWPTLANAIIDLLAAAGLDPEVEAGKEPPTGEFHSSIGLWQLPPPTWEEA